jgi:hypothetical protein
MVLIRMCGYGFYAGLKAVVPLSRLCIGGTVGQTGRGGIIAGRANPATARAIITDSQPTQRGHSPHWVLAREHTPFEPIRRRK